MLEWGLLVALGIIGSLEVQRVFLVVLDLVVNLEAVSSGLQDEDAVVGVNVDRHGTTEPPFGFHVGPAPGLYDVRVGVAVDEMVAEGKKQLGRDP